MSLRAEGVVPVKLREPPRRVMIRARMRVAASWHDVCILNLSSYGMLIHAASPLPRGSYLEIRRGMHVVVARVVWAKHHRAGIRTQDPLPIDAIIAEPDNSTAPPPTAGGEIDRRSESRPRETRHDESRLRSRAIEFAGLAAFGIAGCLMIAGMVQKVMAQPMAAVSDALISAR